MSKRKMASEICTGLRLTAVECPGDVTLPSLELVSQVLCGQLGDIGMPLPEFKVSNNFVPRERNEKDLQYSLHALKESPTDILGLYSTDLSLKSDITLYVDSCLRASKDLSVSFEDLLQIVLIHELAHHATAWAEIHHRTQVFDFDEIFRYCWLDYNECSGGAWANVHEFFAQALAFLCIIERHAELLGAFRTLSWHQPALYRTWEVLHAFTHNDVGLHSIRASLQAQFLALMQAGQRFFPDLGQGCSPSIIDRW
jgi:hypothetical protein